MKIIFTGGGTLGHVIPALTVARTLKKELEKKQDSLEVIYVGCRNSAEEKFLLNAEISYLRFYSIFSGKLRRYFDLRNFIDPIFVLIGIFQSLKIILSERPKLVFSKGGFVTVPVCIAAWILGVPVIIHESDLTMGLANKITAKFAKVVCSSFPKKISEVEEYIKSKFEVTGLPVSEILLNGKEDNYYKRTGFNPEKPKMLVMGGSSGASFINNLIWDNFDELTKTIQIVHIYVQKNIPQHVLNHPNYLPIERVTQDVLADLMVGSDFILSRCGATTLFECMTLGIPLLGIPLPGGGQSRGDQVHNCEFLAKYGAIQYMEQDKFSSQEMINKILAFAQDTRVQNEISGNMRKFDSRSASLKISKIILRCIT